MMLLGSWWYLEGAPVPVARNAGRRIRALSQAETSARCSCDRRGWHVLGLGRSRARGLAVVARVPGLVHVKAVVAGARRDSTGVEIGVLVQGHLEAGVLVAEDVATAAAVVPACEVVEGTLARRVIAYSGLGIRLRFNC